METFLGLLDKALSGIADLELYAWCLMSNHFHLLFHGKIEDVSSCMKSLCGSYAQWFNAKSGRVGHLFQERFRSEPVCDDAYLLTVVRYIHHNPQKARLCDARDYKWSSYSEYVRKPSRSTTSFILDVFGGVRAFEKFHSEDSESDSVMDVDGKRSRTRAMPDELALAVAADVLGKVKVDDVKRLGADKRNALLRKLKQVGLSVRQIQRLTGIGRNVVWKA